MGGTKGWTAVRVIGFCWLVVVLLHSAGVPRAHSLAGIPPAASRSDPAYPMALLRFHPHRRPFDAALREAIDWQQRGVDAAARNQEALKAWDPKAEADDGPAASADWRRQIAQDSSGCLRRARAEARRAAALARTAHELCRADALLAALDCSLGDHKDELRQARRTVALEPRSELSLVCLQHAAHCSGRTRLERQATTALHALRASKDLGSPSRR